ncbi:MAG TPA: O-antigen ligase family protein [Verrucomicrobiae bacterium]|jgi:O-antigen ligase
MHLSPQLALILTLGFMGFLFRREIRRNPQVTRAMWIPVLWLTIIGSRFVSGWLDVFGFGSGRINVEDGSPLDAFIFGLLILSGAYVLYQRQVRLSEIIQNNRWLTVFFVYCFLAILWSDFPFVAFKRWLKVLGHPIMVLVILTEPDPEAAIVFLLKCCSYVWVPVSILFIKYFPQFGRGFDSWTGEGSNGGITTNKNLLGLDLFISGTFFFWYFLKVKEMEKGKERRDEILLIAIFGCMLAWLLHAAHSSTSLVSFFIAAGLMIFVGFRWVNPQNIGIYLVGAGIVAGVAEGVFGIHKVFLHMLGKSPTFTDRTLLWHNVLQMKIDPILGAGYESFWLGDHVKPGNWTGWSFVPNEAHNCYLETYLNLGLVGLGLLMGWFIANFQKAQRDLVNGRHWGKFRVGFLVATLFYNWTEAPFKAVDAVYFVFFLIAMDYPNPQLAPAFESVEIEEPKIKSIFAGAQCQTTQQRVTI